MSQQIVPTRPPSEEDEFFLRQGYENVVTSLGHIEEMAKHLISAVGVVAGLFLAAAQLKTNQPAPLAAFIGPIVFWAASMLLATLVVFPMRYKHHNNAPAAIRDALKHSRMLKWWLLLGATVTFIGGLLWAVLSLFS